MKDGIEHPYWDIYSRLVDLRGATPSAATKDSLRRLAREAGLSTQARLLMELKMLLPWFKTSMVEEAFFCCLRERYSYSVLSLEMLEILSSYSPLVELGAGNGYNAWLLRQLGAEVVAMDAFPVEEGKNWFFNTRLGFPARGGRSFTEVQKGDSKAMAAYADHTLLLCWPPINPMALESLSEYPGERLVFIGNKKCCANPAFYKKLEREWRLEMSTRTGSWDACHPEMLEVYTRQSVPSAS